MLQTGRSRVRVPMSDLILRAALDPGIYSACNRNAYQKQKNNVSGELSATGG
jgi:hypothetical protein